MIWIADVKDKNDKRAKLMLDYIEADTEKEAKGIAEEYGTVIKIAKSSESHRCPECGRILSGKEGLCGNCKKRAVEG